MRSSLCNLNPLSPHLVMSWHDKVTSHLANHSERDQLQWFTGRCVTPLRTDRQPCPNAESVLFLRKHHSIEFCFVSLRKVYNDFKQCVQGTWHAIHVSSFIGGSQPDHICACGQGNPRNPSSFSKPPSAALDQSKSDYTLYALLETLVTANMGEIVLYFPEMN